MEVTPGGAPARRGPDSGPAAPRRHIAALWSRVLQSRVLQSPVLQPRVLWSRARSFPSLLSRHRLFVTILVPAIILRAITMAGFRWALWFNDSYQYVEDTVQIRPDPTRPSGYALYIRVLRHFTHNYGYVTLSQHVMGLAAGVMIYALLLHRFKVSPWIASAAAVPVLYDAFQIQLEHLLMADTLFLFLVVVAVTIVMWRPKPSMAQMATAGLLLGFGALIRSIGLPLLAIFAAYLLLRRAGLRVVVAGIVACGLPVSGYVLWFHSLYHQYAMTQSTGIFLYSRVMAFADCSKFTPTPDETPLCTTASLHRMISQEYIWSPRSPLRRYPPPEFSPVTNRLAKDFSMRAIKAQPAAYARVVWDDTWRSFAWSRKVFPDPITYGEYRFASAMSGPARKYAIGYGFGPHAPPQTGNAGRTITKVVSPYAGFMRSYQKYVFLPGTILGVFLVIGLGGMTLAWRRFGGEILLPWSLSLAMLVIPAATAEFDYRYVLPAVPLACLATAIVFGAGNPIGDRLAARRLRRAEARADAAATAQPATTPATTPDTAPITPADVTPQVETRSP